MIEDDGEDGVRVSLKVVPGARRDQIVGTLDSSEGVRLKIRVSAPPEGGRANKAVCKLLAGTLGVRTGQVEIVQGMASAKKTARVSGINAEQARRALGVG